MSTYSTILMIRQRSENDMMQKEPQTKRFADLLLVSPDHLVEISGIEPLTS